MMKSDLILKALKTKITFNKKYGSWGLSDKAGKYSHYKRMQ
jgi:hypothetical protein